MAENLVAFATFPFRGVQAWHLTSRFQSTGNLGSGDRCCFLLRHYEIHNLYFTRRRFVPEFLHCSSPWLNSTWRSPFQYQLLSPRVRPSLLLQAPYLSYHASSPPPLLILP